MAPIRSELWDPRAAANQVQQYDPHKVTTREDLVIKERAFADPDRLLEQVHSSETGAVQKASLAKQWERRQAITVHLLREQLEALDTQRLEAERKYWIVVEAHWSPRAKLNAFGATKELGEPISSMEEGDTLTSGRTSSQNSSVSSINSSLVDEADHSLEYWKDLAKRMGHLLAESLHREQVLLSKLQEKTSVALMANVEEPTKRDRSSLKVAGHRDVDLEASIGVEGKTAGDTSVSSEPPTPANPGSGMEMDKSFGVGAYDRFSNPTPSDDLHTHTMQHGLKTVPQEVGVTGNEPTPRLQSGSQIQCSASCKIEGVATQSEAGQLPRTLKKASRSFQDQATRLVALRIMYLGSSYHGFASQGASKNTVEAALFAALEHTKLLIGERAEAKYSRCGRTDKGVSAIGQLIALELRSKRKTAPAHEREDDLVKSDMDGSDAEGSNWDRVAAARASRAFEESVSSTIGAEDELDYVGVLNRVLPDDIRVLGWCPVPRDFSARFSCLYREYKYFFINTDLDIDAMKAAGAKFLGDHDFRNFCKMDAANVHNYRRTISKFDVIPVNESWAGRQVWVMRIRGTAFLWHQIRCMAAVLFMVGRREEPPSLVEALLDVAKVPRKPQYIMASELPLVLHTCGFQGLTLHCPSRAAKHLRMHLNSKIEQAIVHLALLQEAMSELPISDLQDNSALKKAHPPLLSRLTEPSYEDRRGKKTTYS